MSLALGLVHSILVASTYEFPSTYRGGTSETRALDTSDTLRIPAHHVFHLALRDSAEAPIAKELVEPHEPIRAHCYA